MPSTATVAHRPRARRAARLPPARSICASSHPPKMSPFGLASAGMAKTRTSGSVLGNSTSDPIPLRLRMRRAGTSHNFGTAATAGRMTTGTAYTYKVLLLCFRTFPGGDNHVYGRPAQLVSAGCRCRGGSCHGRAVHRDVRAIDHGTGLSRLLLWVRGLSWILLVTTVLSRLLRGVTGLSRIHRSRSAATGFSWIFFAS